MTIQQAGEVPWAVKYRSWLWRARRLPQFVLAVVLTVAVLAALGRLGQGEEPTAAILTAGRDLAAGTLLTAGDLGAVAAPVEVAHALGLLIDESSAVGQRVAVPVARGTALSEALLRGQSLADQLPPGTVAVTVTVGDPAAIMAVVPGDYVNVVGSAHESGGVVLAREAMVLPWPPEDVPDNALLLATTSTEAVAIAGTDSALVSVVVVPPGPPDD